jgi:hypothetical protein
MALLLSMGLAPGAEATTLHVPGDVPTIQAALDSIADHDTVLVALGVYAEALTAPALHFVLKGDVVPDTGEYHRPIIDPSTLPGSQSLGCLSLPIGSWPVLEDLVFRNGPQMYPHQENSTGGISIHSFDFTMRRCILDSTFRTLQFVPPGPGLQIVDRLEDCVFRHIQSLGVYQLDYAVEAENCSFESGNAIHFCIAGPHSAFHRCHFGANAGMGALILDGDDSEVTNCTFGPSTVNSTFVLYGGGITQEVILDNVFSDNLVSEEVLRVSGSVPMPTNFLIAGNTFVNNSVSGSGACVRAQSPFQYNELWGGVIRNNTFVDCYSQGGANAILAGQDISITSNRFEEIQPDPFDQPTVQIVQTNQVVLRDNRFDHTGYALQGFVQSVNAIWNWWGDPTGPYHATQNPGGLGDTIEGNVDFDPWYADSSLSVPGLGKPLPRQFEFEAYPNPFNSTVHLTLIPAEVQIVKVELFDLLGRRVQEIWHGPLAFQKDITFDASALTSGIYFARVTEVIDRKTMAMMKLVLLK